MSSEPHILKGLLLGALAAGLFWAAKGPPGAGRDLPQIIVSESDVAHQRARWEKMRGRPPTEEELKKAVDAYVRNEILYREALARGMDREDPRVRMALIQKMQMMAAGQADARGFSEADLEAFFALRKEHYRIPARFSIKQVFFKPEAGAEERIQKLLRVFTEREPLDAALRDYGDATLLANTFDAVTAADFEKVFGTDFTADVLLLPANQWQGPVRSGFGWHAVKVYDRIPGRDAALAEVRDQVEDDLLYETRQAFQERGFQEVAAKYQIRMSDGAEQMLRGEGR